MSLNHALSKSLFVVVMSAILVSYMSADLLMVAVVGAVLGGILLTFLLWGDTYCDWVVIV